MPLQDLMQDDPIEESPQTQPEKDTGYRWKAATVAVVFLIQNPFLLTNKVKDKPPTQCDLIDGFRRLPGCSSFVNESGACLLCAAGLPGERNQQSFLRDHEILPLPFY
jgi:hypothetical protein